MATRCCIESTSRRPLDASTTGTGELIEHALDAGARTRDLGGTLSTVQMGDAVLKAIRNHRRMTVQQVADLMTLNKRTYERFEAGEGFDTLAAAHSRALAKMSGDIAIAIRAEAEDRSQSAKP